MQSNAKWPHTSTLALKLVPIGSAARSKRILKAILSPVSVSYLNSINLSLVNQRRRSMKNEASLFLKRVVSVLTSIAKAKSAAIKSKTSAAKGRLMLFSLMNNRKVLFGSISNKIHSLLGHGDRDSDSEDEGDVAMDQSRALVLYEAKANESRPSTSSTMQLYGGYDDEDDDKYPDLRHCLFDGEEDDDEADPGGSVIDLVKNAKEEGDEFCLEDEIDHCADLFIRRFHKQIRLQKLASFKRLQEMLGRSV